MLGVLAAIVLVVLGTVGSAVGTYNKLVTERETIDAQSKQVDVAYQQAFRAVPQITQLANQYFQNETALQTKIAALRSGASVAENGSFEQKEAFADEVAATRALIIQVVNENYPNLKGNDLFRDTMAVVVNAENRIAMEKVRYNDNVRTYNAHRQQCCIPLFVASSFGFDAREYIGFEDRPNVSQFPVGQQL